MSPKSKILLITLLSVYCSLFTIHSSPFTIHSCLGQDLDFFREDLIFKLTDSTLTVEGDYHFRNNSDQKLNRRLIYPFPLDDDLGEVTWVNSNNKKSPNVSAITDVRENAALLQVSLNPFAFETYYIGYTQKLKNNHAKYILLTTQNWGKPFEIANYKLYAPMHLKIDSISYIPDKIDTVGEFQVYKYSKRNFMPDRDFEVWFQK